MEYNTLVMITPADFKRLAKNYQWLVRFLPVGRLLFVGSRQVGECVKEAGLGSRVGFICEDDILPFQQVYRFMVDYMQPVLRGRELPRGVTGWYYQQFLKMQYASICEDEYYLVWDGDTIPCRTIEMFDETSKIPFMDLKKEYHKEYFDTISVLFEGMEKSIEESFIAEHMLINTEIMRRMISEIEDNTKVEGGFFWEKIIKAIRPEKIQDTAFSEFETFGTYCCHRYPEAYILRRWHSFRLGAQFFDSEKMKDSDYEWLGKDFFAISFEKNQTVREDQRNLFDNPYYQSKLTARQMLEVAQEEFEEGYLEQWEEEDPLLQKIGRLSSMGEEILKPDSPLRYLSESTWKEYEKIGDERMHSNVEQAYLCYENAIFLCRLKSERERLQQKIDHLQKKYGVQMRKVAIVILSYNNMYFMQRCLESIYTNCDPASTSVIVLDNASTDGVTQWLKKQPGERMTLLLSDENLGFAAGCNAAAAYVPKDCDILFLNNDTRITANALFWMRMALYESDKVGAAGAVQNYGTEPQHIELDFAVPEMYMEYGAHNNTDVDNATKSAVKLSGFAMLVKRNVWDCVGGFDEQFSPGYFEDDDLCMRIQNEGFELKVCRNAFIYHAGSQSFVHRKDIEELFERNRKKFIAKWGQEI